MSGGEESKKSQAGRYWKKSFEHSLEESSNPANVGYNLTTKKEKGKLKHLQNNALRELDRSSDKDNPFSG